MKIVNIILTSQNGGAEQAFFDYSVALKNLGHDVLAILKDDAPYGDKVENLGIEIKRTANKWGYYDCFAIRNIQKVLKDFDADIVISHMSRSTVLTKKALKGIQNKKILQAAVNHSDNVKRSIGVDIILSVNAKILERTVALGQDPERSFVIPNAIDLADIIQNPASNDLSKKETIVIGGIGRLDRTKGFDELIKAVKTLNENGQQKFVLKLAGAGYFEPELRELVKALALEDQVEFLGWIKDKKAFFEGIDVFCLPSKNEPFGIVLLEAMKYGKPIIATKADGPLEILRDGVDALMIDLKEEGFAEHIADAVVRLVKDVELMDDLVKNATQKLEAKYSYLALKNRMKEIVGIPLK